jgi:Zn-finger protein
VSKTIYRQVAGLVAAGVFMAGAARGADAAAKFLGANSCASASCHGGGGASQNQFLVWSLKDFHSQRPTATLTTARSKQIADALGIKEATVDARCTVCHTPLNAVSENLRGENFKVSEGVSCESCHGAAEKWIRSHTRKDYTRADLTAAGMRDLQNLYVRANTCVACHQNVDTDILKAGHPELIFELDGQSVAEPKHWSAEKNGSGAQAWLVGQAVALREMSWQLANEKSPTDNQIARWNALVWLLQIAAPASDLKVLPRIRIVSIADDGVNLQGKSDQVARNLAATNWTDVMTRKILFTLASSSGGFGNNSISQNLQARRAERLVLALDRLVAALPELKNNAPVQAALNQLFQLAQSVPDFDPKQFAAALEKFSAALPQP